MSLTCLTRIPLASPQALRHAHTYCGPRLALMGDAAHAIHPLAGQARLLPLSLSLFSRTATT